MLLSLLLRIHFVSFVWYSTAVTVIEFVRLDNVWRGCFGIHHLGCRIQWLNRGSQISDSRSSLHWVRSAVLVHMWLYTPTACAWHTPFVLCFMYVCMWFVVVCRPDDLPSVQTKQVMMEGYRSKACSWRGVEAFSRTSSYNLCLPLRPRNEI